MSDSQRKVLVAIIAAVVVALLFPPFHLQGSDGRVINQGYSFLFAPPYGGKATVNIGFLFVEWIGILIVGGLVSYGMRQKG